mmetsp:Transcript_25281/g.31156  ORF Transcript_25281/g.31156 Transcript_25281/m.31156 type:complete len:317 (-) Transcript_25281:298-1248(-)
MAAVLCKGCSDGCSGCCSILTCPCKIFGECCQNICEAASQLCRNPFCLYVFAALGLNIPPIASGSVSLVGDFGCSATLWQLVNMVLCGLNIAASFYIAFKFHESPNDGNEHSNPNRRGQSGFNKVSQILCYDPIVAIYILVLIGFFGWLCTGVSWRASGAMNCADDSTLALVSASLGCGFSFLSFGFFALCCAFCCSCCCDGDGSSPFQKYNNNSTKYEAPTHGKQSAPAAASMNRPPSYAHNYGSSTAPAYSDVENYPTATAVPVNEPIPAKVVEPSAPYMANINDNKNKGSSLKEEAVARVSAVGAKLGQMLKK